MPPEFKIKLNPIKWLIPVLSIWAIIFAQSYYLSTIDLNESLGWAIGVFLVMSFITGVLQHHLAILGHDGAHYLVCKNKTLNDVLTMLLSFGPAFVNMKNYRKFHGDHHKYVGTDKDTEIPIKKIGHKQYSSPQSGVNYVGYFFKDLFLLGGLREMSSFILLIIKGNILSTVLTWSASFSILVAINYLITGTVIPFILLWYFSLVFSFWASFRLRVYFEHSGLDTFSQSGYQEQHTQCIEFTPQLAWFRFLSCWWGVYHIYHHMNQDIPLHQMKEYKKYLQDTGQAPTSHVISNPLRYLAQLGVKGQNPTEVQDDSCDDSANLVSTNK
ncbi:fatty acid desaturase family protein [Catenovulum sp. SX2]|uniref:fatty acid desaturase family protein n=1 Tax=Catenovulum sp. SX2 TaxID=3398614 RepID=UPI003F843E5A